MYDIYSQSHIRIKNKNELYVCNYVHCTYITYLLNLIYYKYETDPIYVFVIYFFT